MKRWTIADVLTVCGTLVLAGGAACVYPPAGLIVLGVAAVGFGLLLDIEKNRTPRDRP